MKYIVFSGSTGLRNGGPSGYLANLELGLSTIDNSDVRIISTKNISGTNQNYLYKLKSNIKDIIKRNIYLEQLSYINSMRKVRANIINNLPGNAVQKDIFHFHTVIDFYYASKMLDGYKKILTTHTPESISREVIGKFQNNNINSKKLNIFKKYINKIERDSIKNADFLIYPSKEALEPYYESIEGFSELIKDKRIYYNYTGCNRMEFELSKSDFLNKYNISSEKFIVSFVGRHNLVKGFDILIDAFDKVSQFSEDIIFIVAGTGNIKQPDSNRFINIGWTKDPGSLINASDLFVLPNRQTYFDLVLLEVLSLGKPVIASNTGGNKTVASLTEGVQIFKKGSSEDLAKKIVEAYNNRDQLVKWSNDNSKCYEQYFTVQKFAQRYKKIMDEIEAL